MNSLTKPLTITPNKPFLIKEIQFIDGNRDVIFPATYTVRYAPSLYAALGSYWLDLLTSNQNQGALLEIAENLTLDCSLAKLTQTDIAPLESHYADDLAGQGVAKMFFIRRGFLVLRLLEDIRGGCDDEMEEILKELILAAGLVEVSNAITESQEHYEISSEISGREISDTEAEQMSTALEIMRSLPGINI